MKKMIKPILVLTLICLCVSILLAVVNEITAPKIKEYEAKIAEKGCLEVMPDGESFVEIELPDGLPQTVTNVYKEEGGGYVFKLVTNGYSSGYQIMCGISADGKITGTKVLAHNETPSIGGQTQDKSYCDRYVGAGADLKKENGESVDYLISHATVSTTAFKNAIADAFTAYETLNEEG